MESGELVHISNTKRGLACRCVCSGQCGRRVIAHRGRIRPHFQHQRAEDGHTCLSAGETALHKFAKGILSKRLELCLPALEETDGWNTVAVVKEKCWKFSRVILEMRHGEIVPDVICLVNDRRLLVEFAVTHFCASEKIEKIKTMNIGAIEIDLSKYRDAQLSELENIILFDAERRWLHNPRTAGAKEELLRLEKIRRSAIEAEAHRLVRLVNSAPLKTGRTGDWRTRASENRILSTLSSFSKIEPGFLVPSGEWKLIVLLELGIKNKSGFTIEDAFERLKNKQFVQEEFNRVDDELVEYMKSEIPTFQTPWNCLSEFLADMVKKEFLLKDYKKRFFGGRLLFKTVKEAAWRRELPSERRREVIDTVEEILKLSNIKTDSEFSFDDWLLNVIKSFEISGDDFWLCSDEAWCAIVSPLHSLIGKLRIPSNLIDDDMGLPISAEINRRKEAKLVADAKIEADRKQREAESIEKRCAELTIAAQGDLGDDSDAWLNNPTTEFLESPLDLAKK